MTRARKPNSHITQTEETVLVREIGKLVGFFAGFGARFAARRLPVEERVTSMVLAGDTADVRANVREILESIGTLTNEFDSANPRDRISAIVGSGHMNLNPTIVHVQIDSSEGATVLTIRALAKEGLVKQESAQRAIERIETLLTNRYASAETIE
jgi:hypothetical protein